MRAALVAFGVVVALVPVGASAGTRIGPPPVSPVVVVKTGTWAGRSWRMTAYRSQTDGLCFGWALTRRHDRGATLACAPIVGVPGAARSKSGPPLTITFAAAGAPPHVYGPVTARAVRVAAYFAGGTVVRTGTFAAPPALGASVRFYAAQLRKNAAPTKLVGLDRGGRVVACLVRGKHTLSFSLAACR